MTAFPAVSQSNDGPPGIGTNVDGALSAADALRFKELVADFKVAQEVNAGKWTGLLAEGPITNPRVLFRLLPDDGEQSPDSQAFLAITRLFEPYLRPYYPIVN